MALKAKIEFKAYPVKTLDCAITADNLWLQHFKMFAALN